MKDKYQTITDAAYVLNGSLNRIADSLEEILRMVKTDQERAEEARIHYKMEQGEKNHE